MPNGQDMLDNFDLERELDAKRDLKELVKFSIRQIYEVQKKLQQVCENVESNTKKTNLNRVILITLIIVLIITGVVDATVLHVFAF
jgi:hypothetical protein